MGFKLNGGLKTMKGRILLIVAALLVAAGGMGVSYATISGGAGLYCTTPVPSLTCSNIFTCASTRDNEFTADWEHKDVGHITASISSSGKTLSVTVTNAYPLYEGYVDFCIKNTGSLQSRITSIVVNNPNPITVTVNSACVVGAVLTPGQIKNCTLTVGGVVQREDTQDQTYNFDVTINFECVPSHNETAYGYLCYNCTCCSCSPFNARCFTYYGFTNWGWSNGKLGKGTYVFDLYAGAANCDRWRGTKVGTVRVVYANSTVTVTYQLLAGYSMTATHLYIGGTPLPVVGGQYTCSPGQYPYKHDGLNYVTTDTYTVNNVNGCIYVVAHADVAY